MQDWLCGVARVPHVERERHQRRDGETNLDGGRQQPDAEALAGDDQGADANRREHEARGVERPRVLGRQVRREGEHRRDAGDADGQVHVEDPAPLGERQDEPRDRRADERTNERWHREPRHRGHEPITRRGPHDDSAANGGHHRAAHALHDARRDELPERLRHAAQRRAKEKHHHREDEDTPCAKAVRRPAARWREHGQRQEVAGERELQMHRIALKRARERRQRRRQGGGVDELHERRGGDGQRRESGANRTLALVGNGAAWALDGWGNLGRGRDGIARDTCYLHRRHFLLHADAGRATQRLFRRRGHSLPTQWWHVKRLSGSYLRLMRSSSS